MYVLTETEYEEIVNELAGEVFDPLSDDSDVVETSLEILDLADDGRQGEAQEILREQARYVARFGNSLPYERVGAPYMPGTLAGSIIEHSTRSYRVKTEDLEANNAKGALTESAIETLYADIKGEASGRIRHALDESDD